MNVRDPCNPVSAASVLTPDEQRLLEKLQQLAAEGKEEVDPEVMALADQVRWNRDDPASLARAVYFMAHDPFLRREVAVFNAAFPATETC
jgi:hypothetical protein